MAKQPHDKLVRKMEARHLLMISLGGVIGTGLFLSSGYTIQQAGPQLARSSSTSSCCVWGNYPLPCLKQEPFTFMPIAISAPARDSPSPFYTGLHGPSPSAPNSQLPV